MGDTFTLTICCPVPRATFDSSGKSCENELEQLPKILDSAGDMVLLPEGFLSAHNLVRASELIRSSGRWVISGAEQDDRNLTVLAFAPDGQIVYCHQKTALTDGDIQLGRVPGEGFQVFSTPYAVVGTPLCYEIHFPEIARIFALLGAQLLLNPIGTGMYHQLQLSQWLAIARCRAIENGVYVAGCTHFCGAIPIAYAYAPDGTELGLLQGNGGCLDVVIDSRALPPQDWRQHRTPQLYGELCR